MRVKKIAFLLCLFAIVLGCCFAYRVDAQTPKPINSIATIIYDMQPPHEGIPHGVPSHYSWATKPSVGSNNPKQFKAMTAWGQLV